MRLVQAIRIALRYSDMNPFLVHHEGATYKITPVCLRRDGTKMWVSKRV